MTEPEIKVETVSIDDANDETITTDTETQTVQPDENEKRFQELNDKYLRLAAELENTRRRAALDAESRARNRAISVAEKILPVMDAIDAALKHSPDDAGIQSMARAMESAFAQIGITKIESVGQQLNPMFHNAIQAVPAPTAPNSATIPNTIIDEMQTGYMFGDTVLRTAMVVVSK